MKYVKPESQAGAKHKRQKLTCAFNTKSDFFKKLNECAEKAFGDDAQHIIDNLLYAKLPPHLKWSLNLATLEKSTNDQINERFRKEIELSGLENDGELLISTKIAILSNDNTQKTEQSKFVGHYCEKPGHVIRECHNRMKKEQEQRNDPSFLDTKPSTSKVFALFPYCQQKNNPPEKCCSGPKATNRPKRFKQDQPAVNLKEWQEQGKLTNSGPKSILKNPLN